MNKRAFTLMELLIVIAMIAVLAALLFPVFLSVRAKGRQTACLSNLEQLGLAFSLYAHDNDDQFAYGGDVNDIHSSPNVWITAAHGEFAIAATTLKPLPEVLDPYIKNNELWHCPSDTGFDYLDTSSTAISAHPSSYEQYGCSYYYRTTAAFKNKTFADLTGCDDYPPYAAHGASEIDILNDGSGSWHGGVDETVWRYNVLYGDFHAKNIPRVDLNDARALKLDNPQS